MGQVTSPPLLDETGISAVTALNKIAQAISSLNGDIYGFIEHMDVLSPSQRIEWTDKNASFSNPLTVNKSAGTFSYGDWSGFPLLVNNKPYMVKADGTPDYRLNENDYTKKLDGTASDVANTSYAGGAFSWLQRIYKYESRNGSDRIVKFSFTKHPGFLPVGFEDDEGHELSGVWLPMFYGTVVDSKAKCIAAGNGLSGGNLTTDAQHTAVAAFHAKARFFGGPIVETIIDLLMMFAKTSDLQDAYGNGNMSGYVSASPYGMKDNAVVGGGQFYGTTDGSSLNKIFHSIVLGSYQQWMRDPYEVVVNGKIKVSKNYVYDPTGALYFDTGITVPDLSAGWRYPKLYHTVEGYGSLPDVSSAQGSTTTGPCDGTYSTTQSTLVAVSLRFGRCDRGALDGPRARSWGSAASNSDWNFGFALLLKGPVAA